MKTDKEIIKILAEAVLDSYSYYRENIENDYATGYPECIHCNCSLQERDRTKHEHKPECPVLLAEEVLSSKVYEDMSDIILNDSCVGCPLHIKNEGQDLNIWCKEGYKYPEHGICFTKVKLLLKKDEPLDEPLIVHNVLKYKGEYYLKQVAKNNCISCALYNFTTGCYITSNMCCGTGFNWKSFKDIQLTDELACMRKDIGDIYIIRKTNTEDIGRFIGIDITCPMISHSASPYPIESYRLATTEEIQEYLENKK